MNADELVDEIGRVVPTDERVEDVNRYGVEGETLSEKRIREWAEEYVEATEKEAALGGFIDYLKANDMEVDD